MRLCVNKLSALALLRHVRVSGEYASAQVCGLPEPDPHPQHRWTARIIPHQLLGLSDLPSSSRPVYVAVPSKGARPLASFFKNTLYLSGLPEGSFLQLGESLAIPCPELLFVELATIMKPAALGLLGYELCGSFCRDPLNPRSGKVTHGLSPVTDVASIRSFIEETHRLTGTNAARRALLSIEDNAWSAMEATIALLLKKPVTEHGYGIRRIHLNERQDNPWELVRRGCANARVPDIVLDDCPVGFNYDGHGHLDLESVAAAAENKDELGRALASLRQKYVDDRRRDRELAAQGRIVMSVVSEDLFDHGGLDIVILEALMASERLGGPRAKDVLPDEVWAPEETRARQRLIWSLLPWEGGESLGPC